jgi:GntR family transcriptional regulator/MocR family aminotransferase
MRIPIDRESPVPLYQQIKSFLGEQILSGALAPETRLPASRELAAELGVSRVTVTNAYADLEADGLIWTRIGGGTFVGTALETGWAKAEAGSAPRDWPAWQQGLMGRTWLPIRRDPDSLHSDALGNDVISLGDGVGDDALFPLQDFRKALSGVLHRDGHKALGYGDRAGYLPLRTTIAQILSVQGIPTQPGEVLITSGSQQGIALVAHVLLRPGDTVLVENPTYVGAIDLFRSMDVRLIGVPTDPEGMVVEELEDLVTSSRPKLIYTIPTFHNPTGTCLNSVRRRRLIEIARKFNVPILEDDFAGELRYEGRAQPALKALDPGGLVIFVRTFSKILMPALRVGFLVASGPVYDCLLNSKRTLDLATSDLIQRALDGFITVGKYQSHLRRACRVYRERRDAMLDALAHHMPQGVRWRKPDGGLFIWLQLPQSFSAQELAALAGKEGVLFSPGSAFFPAERDQPYLRLTFATHPPDAIEAGISRLARAIRRYLDRDERSLPPLRAQETVSV